MRLTYFVRRAHEEDRFTIQAITTEAVITGRQVALIASQIVSATVKALE